jgi:glycine hydroxymethyltransferase
LTTRGLVEKDMDVVVDFIDKALKLSKEISTKSGPKLLDYKNTITSDSEIKKKVADLRAEVEAFSCNFPLPGYPDY